MPVLHGFQSSQPAALLFVEPAEKQVQPTMESLVGMIAWGQTVATLARMRFLHGTSFHVLGLLSAKEL